MNRQRGFVAIEWISSVAFLLLPVVVIVATLPVWAERRHAATVAAREAVRELVAEWPAAEPADAARVAREVAAAHGVDTAQVEVNVVNPNATRGDDVRVDVRIPMPAVAIMGIRIGGWHYTAMETRRVDDYRSR